MGGRPFVKVGIVLAEPGPFGGSGTTTTVALNAAVIVLPVATVAHSDQVWNADPERRAL